MTFARRIINLTMTLGATPQNANPTFPGTNSNVVNVKGLRTSVDLVKAGGRGLTTAHVRVRGLPLSVMNQLSTLGVPIIYWVGKNTLAIEAGDEDSGVSTLFIGTITQAWADFDDIPDAAFEMIAFVGAYEAAANAAPTSFPGPFDVATAMSGMATVAGYNFVNNGVNARLPPSYFPGSIMAQIKALADAAGISYIVDNGTLSIWPAGQQNGSAPAILLTPDTGLVGYPRYTGQGIAFRCLYTPSMTYGCKVDLQSSLGPNASGEWVVYKLAYDLEAEMPDGAWFCEVEAARPGFAVVASP